MMGSYVSNFPVLAALIAADEAKPESERDGIRDTLRGQGAIWYTSQDGQKTWAWLMDTGPVQALWDSHPEVEGTFYTPEQVFGYREQERDEDGNLLWDEVPYTEEYTEQVPVGSHEVPITRLEKQINPLWSMELVQNRNDDPDDDIQDGSYEEGFHEEWTFLGTPEIDGEGNEVYPPKYVMVEVDTGETETVIDYGPRQVVESGVRRVPRMVAVPADPEAAAAFAACYDSSPVEIKDEQGNGTGQYSTPDPMGTVLQGYRRDHLVLEN